MGHHTCCSRKSECTCVLRLSTYTQRFHEPDWEGFDRFFIVFFFCVFGNCDMNIDLISRRANKPAPRQTSVMCLFSFFVRRFNFKLPKTHLLTQFICLCPQNFLMNKKQNAATNGMTSAASSYRGLICRGVVKSSSGEAIPAGSVSSAHPYKIPQPPSSISKYDSDFPLRKTGTDDPHISHTLLVFAFVCSSLLLFEIVPNWFSISLSLTHIICCLIVLNCITCLCFFFSRSFSVHCIA